MNQPDFSALPQTQLERMAEAGVQIIECYRVLKKGGINIVGEVLKGQGEFYELDHYPKEDVFDSETHSQYYYHAHRIGTTEHGHFHTFLRQPGMPARTLPIQYTGEEAWPKGKDAISHLIAISMDAYGFPIEIFTTNRWVTAEAWYKSEDVIAMLDHFQVDHAFPSWPVNIWLSSMLVLFRPQIESLLLERDNTVANWIAKYPNLDVFEDRRLEVTSSIMISVEKQIKAVAVALHENT